MVNSRCWGSPGALIFLCSCLILDSPVQGQHPEMAHCSVSFPASSRGEVFGIYLKATEYYFLSRCCINTKHNQGSAAWNNGKGPSKSSREETRALLIQRYLPSATQTHSFLSLSRNGVAGSGRSHTATAMSSSCRLIPLHLFLHFPLVFSFSLPFPPLFPLPAFSSSPSHLLPFSTSPPDSISYFGSYPSPLLPTTVSSSFHAPFHIHFHFQGKLAGQMSTCSCQRQDSVLQFPTDFLQLFGV